MTVKSKKNIKHKIFRMVYPVFVFMFCLMLLPFDQLDFIKGTAYADSNDMVDYNLGLDEQDNTVTINNDIKKTLWRINITPAVEEKKQVQKDELQLLIEQVNSIELLLPQTTFEPDEVYEAVSSNEPEKTVPQKEDTQSNVNIDKSESKNYVLITEQTIKKLKKMAEKPEEVDNPYEIGNTLYLSNNIGEAAAFYQEALRRKKPDDLSASGDRAWLLFQTGNSLQTIDMLAASDFYKKLITEYPNSPWADYARVQSNVITWYINDKPDELLKENKR